jgi:methylenetetrahydrofolate reductase (NADPH)
MDQKRRFVHQRQFAALYRQIHYPFVGNRLSLSLLFMLQKGAPNYMGSSDNQINASLNVSLSVPATANSQAGAFLRAASIEITGKQIDKIPLLQQNLASGTHVFIALIDATLLEAQIEACAALRTAGFVPVPHIPARFVVDADDLDRRLEAFVSKGKVKSVLVLGGGAPEPVGRFHCALQLMETGAFQRHDIESIGIAGHPEGNPDITKIYGEAMLLRTLKEKHAWIKDAGLQGFIATQFLFNAEPVVHWAIELKENGINLPIHVGVPGPASIKTLIRYAALCGVGNSARFIRKQALNITKLLTVSEPTEFVEQLAKDHYGHPEHNIAGAHLYPFGGFDKLFEWMHKQTNVAH